MRACHIHSAETYYILSYIIYIILLKQIKKNTLHIKIKKGLLAIELVYFFNIYLRRV